MHVSEPGYSYSQPTIDSTISVCFYKAQGNSPAVLCLIDQRMFPLCSVDEGLMHMRVSDLAAVDSLGLTLVSTGVMDRPIRSVYTTDLPAPGEFLEGGELVLTSATWYRTPVNAETFVGGLSSAKAAALAVGVAGIGAIPQPVREACGRHQMPLFVVADDVSFARIIEAVSGLLSGPGGASPGADVHRRLLASLASGAPAEDLVTLFGRATGIACVLLSSTGRRLTGLIADVSDEEVQRLFRVHLPQGARSAIHRTSGRQSRAVTFLPVQSPVPRRPPAAYLLLRGESAGWAPGVADAALEVCALLAIDRANGMEGRRFESRLLHDAYDLARGGKAADADLRFGALGIDLTSSYVAVTASSESTSYGSELAAALLEDVADEVPGCTLPLRIHGDHLMLIPATDEAATTQLLRNAAQRLAPLLAPGSIAFGTSTCALGPAAVGVALSQSHHAHRIALRRAGLIRTASSQDLSSHLLLLASLPDEVKSIFRRRLIGVLEDYDNLHKTDLLPTLEAFLGESGSWARTADRLHLHVNTVRYRLARVEKLTAHDLRTLEDRIDFLLALNIGPTGL